MSGRKLKVRSGSVASLDKESSGISSPIITQPQRSGSVASNEKDFPTVTVPTNPLRSGFRKSPSESSSSPSSRSRGVSFADTTYVLEFPVEEAEAAEGGPLVLETSPRPSVLAKVRAYEAMLTSPKEIDLHEGIFSVGKVKTSSENAEDNNSGVQRGGGSGGSTSIYLSESIILGNPLRMGKDEGGEEKELNSSPPSLPLRISIPGASQSPTTTTNASHFEQQIRRPPSFSTKTQQQPPPPLP